MFSSMLNPTSTPKVVGFVHTSCCVPAAVHVMQCGLNRNFEYKICVMCSIICLIPSFHSTTESPSICTINTTKAFLVA